MSELQITERGLLALFRTHTERLQRRLAEAGVDVMVVTSVDSIYYLTGTEVITESPRDLEVL